jgi:Phage stabilisation protein
LPYTKAPSIATNSTERLNFVYNPMHRTGANLNKDATLKNVLIDVFQSPDNNNTKVFVKSRPGLASVYTTTSGRARGIYYWVVSGVGYAISVSGNKLYSNGTLLSTLTTSTGNVGFTEFVNSTGIVTLILLDGTKGYVFSSPTVAPTEITDVDFPTPHIAMPVFLDGYLFVAKSNTQDIYNSNLNDPTLWTAGDFISAEMYPDKIVALTRNNNYIYAIGNASVEFLYDAANATASPLARHDSAVQQFGAAAPFSVVSTDKEVIFVGETGNGGHTVWTIDGFKENEIANPAIRSILRVEGSALASANAHSIRVSGQKLYILTLSTKTLVYSFDTKMWFEWSSGTDGASSFIGSHAADGPNGMAYILDALTGNVYTVSEDNHTDNGTGFLCEIITPKYDFSTMNRKFMSRFCLVGDWPVTSGTGNNVSISWSDNDYQTWSTPRTLSFDHDFPIIAQLGNFRRRAFKISYSQPYLLRLEAMEVDINKGNQ